MDNDLSLIVKINYMTNYKKRLKRLQSIMEEKGLDLVVLGASPDFQYITGTTIEWRKHRDLNSPAESLFVPIDDAPIMLIGKGNKEKVSDCWIKDQRSLGMFEDKKTTVKKIMADLDFPRTIGIGEYTWGSLVITIANYSKGGTFKSAEGLLDKMRMIKDNYEVEKLKRVARLTDAVMGKVIGEINDESTMRGVSLQIEKLGRKLGASDVSFPTTAGFCKSGSEPVGVFNYEIDQFLEPQTAIAFDIGFVLDGYCSDWGRSVYYGDPAEHIEKAYPALMTAVVETIDAMGGEVQRVNQIFDHIELVCEREGYKDKLLERLPNRMVGHQIGIEVHEDPWLKPDQDQELVDGMLFCIEPKLWHKGEYYLRVEDMILIKNGKAESLTKFDRELFQL
jgi:Xaa-Pro aminopeptidase